MLRVLLLSMSLVGCTSVPAPQATTNPISPIHVNCYYSMALSAELAQIIDNPNTMSSKWEHTFSKLSGYSTAQQKVSSAKSVLWTIRTRCPGS